MLLHNLIADRRSELLRRSRAKLAGSSAYELDYWLPILLDLLAEALERDADHPLTLSGEAAAGPPTLERPGGPGDPTLEHPIRRLGITLERVTRDCVELQQAIIELAFEEHSSLSASQFHALDRCVAGVVADARAGCQNVLERVVVVETDRQVRGLLQRFVGDIYLLEFLDDGSSALDRVRSEPPSLLITEILVPRLDGLTLCRLLKTARETARVPVLVYSVLAAEQRARQFGADGFLEKPLEKGRLLASMRELTSGSPGPKPHDEAAE